MKHPAGERRYFVPQVIDLRSVPRRQAKHRFRDRAACRPLRKVGRLASELLRSGSLERLAGQFALNNRLDNFLITIDVLLSSAQNAQHRCPVWMEEIMQIYQGNFVADIEPIKNKRTPQTTRFRIRLIQLHPVELLISDSIATDAHAAREKAEAKLREVLACEQLRSKAA